MDSTPGVPQPRLSLDISAVPGVECQIVAAEVPSDSTSSPVLQPASNLEVSDQIALPATSNPPQIELPSVCDPNASLPPVVTQEAGTLTAFQPATSSDSASVLSSSPSRSVLPSFSEQLDSLNLNLQQRHLYLCLLCSPSSSFNKFQALLSHVRSKHQGASIPPEMPIGTCPTPTCGRSVDLLKADGSDGRCNHCLHRKNQTQPVQAASQADDDSWTPVKTAKRKQRSSPNAASSSPQAQATTPARSIAFVNKRARPLSILHLDQATTATPVNDSAQQVSPAEAQASQLQQEVGQPSPPSSGSVSPRSASLAAGSTPASRVASPTFVQRATFAKVVAQQPSVSAEVTSGDQPGVSASVPAAAVQPQPQPQQQSQPQQSRNASKRSTATTWSSSKNNQVVSQQSSNKSSVPATSTAPVPAVAARTSRPCCGIIHASESSLLEHIRSAHSAGGLIHLSEKDLQAFGFSRCPKCLQVVLPGIRHPANCTVLEANADAAILRASLRLVVQAGRISSYSALMTSSGLSNFSWQSITARVIVPYVKFPSSPTLRSCWREVFLVATKPLLEPQPSETAWKLFALLPWLLFQRPAVKPCPTPAKTLQARFQMFLAGSWTQLISEANANELEWSRTFSQLRSSAPDPEVKRLARVSTVAAMGDISRAANILSSSATLLDPSQDASVADKVRSPLVSPAAASLQAASSTPAATGVSSGVPSGVPSGVSSGAASLPAISAKDAKSAISSTGLTAAGPTGWHISVIKVLSSDESCLNRVTSLLNLLLSSRVPQACLDLFSSGALTVLSKPNGGVRPIVTRSTWLRLLSKSIVSKEQAALSRSLAPLQSGVGMKGGAEFIVHSARHLLQENAGWVLTAIDAANAYGTISRAAIRKELVTSLAPHSLSLAYFDRFCGPAYNVRHGRDFLVSVSEGVIQGDPLSPLFFALALQPSLVRTYQEVTRTCPSARLFAYLDDVCIVAPMSVIPSSFACFQDDVAKIGLLVNTQKTQLFCPSSSADGSLAEPLQQLQAKLSCSLASSSVKLLGAVLEQNSANSGVSALGVSADEVKLFNRLDSIASLQLRLLLLRISVSRCFLHRLRTSPPEQSGAFADETDKLIANSLSLLVGNQGVPLSSLSLKEALLPASLGGLDIPCLSASRSGAYIASVLASLQLWRKYLPDTDPLLVSWAGSSQLTATLAAFQDVVASAASVSRSNLSFPVSAKDAVVYSFVNKMQQRLQSYVNLNAVTELKLQALNTTTSRAQYLSKTSRGAKAFLSACPTDNGLRLSNEEMELSLRLWLRLPILDYFDAPSSLPCFCKPGMILCEDHILNCNGEAARDVRHNTVVLCFQEMLQAAVQQPVLLEPRATTSTMDHHRFDISVAAFDSASRNLKLDVTVRNPLAKHMLPRSSQAHLSAASDAVKEKLAKYAKYLSSSDWFLPLAIESFGALHPNVFQLVSLCAQRVGNVAPDSSCYLAPSFSSYWLQRLSCTLVKENARLINVVVRNSLRYGGFQIEDQFQSSFPPLPDLEE